MANYANRCFQLFTRLVRSALLSSTIRFDDGISYHENISTGKYGTGGLGDPSSRTGGAICLVAFDRLPDTVPAAWPDECVRSRHPDPFRGLRPCNQTPCPCRSTCLT